MPKNDATRLKAPKTLSGIEMKPKIRSNPSALWLKAPKTLSGIEIA